MTRTLRILGWLLLAGVAFATLSPIGLRPHLMSPTAERALAFAVLGAVFALAYPRRLNLAVLIVIGSAVLLEALQLVTPSRHGQLFDLAVKLGGGGVGLLFGILLSRWPEPRAKDSG